MDRAKLIAEVVNGDALTDDGPLVVAPGDPVAILADVGCLCCSEYPLVLRGVFSSGDHARDAWRGELERLEIIPDDVEAGSWSGHDWARAGSSGIAAAARYTSPSEPGGSRVLCVVVGRFFG